MWLLEDLQVSLLSKDRFKGYASFKRLKGDIGLPKEVKEPAHPLKIGSKYEIRKIEVNEKMF
jgi:hypothetical protein